VYGIEQSRRDAATLIDEAFTALEPYGSRAEGLKSVARYLVERKN
jgi:geranylgeranyl diphosphate synthase type II